ncbi:helix-turn-helix domain-containing protein [Paenibacillus tarimensis]|uniref:helix-turn-helix domain-containing protein n=1 Tax=Paenibacillus tarimensis TaxID=416012 RepID=UPI001F3917DE|nr:helix-turn-helix transcriptional regulator [Paenibacillus tarimensis]MCF2944920.1 helix-turn-helix domain-containing protein [Paenibacillus tarimensis]
MGLQKEFGSRVKELRSKIGLSQEILAYQAGLDRTYICGVERGQRNISLENIGKIADALHVPIAQLFPDELSYKRIPQPE